MSTWTSGGAGTPRTRIETLGTCQVCARPIRMQIYRGTGVCSALCAKHRDRDQRLAAGTP